MGRTKRKAEDEPDAEDLIDDEPPTDINPYEVLAVPSDASQDSIKKAYRKAALKHHPDKAVAADKDSAHAKFQEVAFAYAILSDERRRKRYDTTGRTEESLDIDDDDFNWIDFFREQFQNVVNEEAINNFSQGYKGGEEERGHVLKAYEKVNGNMDKLYGLVMLSDPVDDEYRFRAIIDKAIADGEVGGYKRYIQEPEKTIKKRIDSARKRAENFDAKQAEGDDTKQGKSSKKAGKKAKGEGDMGDLAALIQQRQQGRAGNFFDNLEAKYAPKGKKAGKKETMNEPPEDAFAANRRKGGGGDVAEGARKSKRAKK